MYGLRIATFASPRERRLPALRHASGWRCKTDEWDGGLERQCRHTHECWRAPARWTVGTDATIIFSLPASGGTAAAARPGVERGSKWDAGAENIFSAVASAQAFASQTPLRFCGGRSLRLRRWPLACAGLFPGNGAIRRLSASKRYTHSHCQDLAGGCNAFACWFALALRYQLSRAAIY